MALLAGGCRCRKSSVWRRIRPVVSMDAEQDELLSPGVSEDYAFSDLCRKNGIKLWARKLAAIHLHTTDLTQTPNLHSKLIRPLFATLTISSSRVIH